MNSGGAGKSEFDPANYGPALGPLLEREGLNELGPGKPNTAVRKELAALTVESAFAGKMIVDHDMAAACLAGVWLRHDFFDESHELSQSIETPTGSFWHGILHRREPDFDNAKYWFRRVGLHAIFRDLLAAARDVAKSSTAPDELQRLTQATTWDAMAFVDLCRAATRGSAPLEKFCRQVQQREWELLMDFLLLPSHRPVALIDSFT